MKRPILLTLLVFASLTSALAQTVKPEPKSKLFDASRLISDIRTLSADDMEGRSPQQASIEKARKYVKDRFTESGIKPFGVLFEQNFDIKLRGKTDPVKGMNYVGLIKGKKYADKYIVITAHYDHVGISKGQTYNGADDNASGTAALFAIASYFAKNQPNYSLVFVAFDAEEVGLLGARHFVANLPVKKADILLNVNMDMVSRNDKSELYASGLFHYPRFKKALVAAQKGAKVKLVFGHDDPKLGRDDWTNQSDHAAFHREKIPFIYFGVEDHSDYHKPTDDFERIQPNFYVRAVETIIGSINELDKTK